MVVEFTDQTWVRCGALKNYSLDLEVGGKNDFQIKMNLKKDCLKKGCIWFVDSTEYGGIVDRITVDTRKNTVTYYGRSWRGILQKKILSPDSGQDYLTVSGDLNAVLKQLISRLHLETLFTVPDNVTGVTIAGYQFDRYVDAYEGITKMLDKYGMKLGIRMENDVLTLEALPVMDLSNTYEYSDDYGMGVILKKEHGGVNHLICLGNGELASRTCVHLYVDADGNVSETQTFTGTDEIVAVYDYPNVSTLEELKKGGTERLNDLKSKDTIDATFEKLDVNVGDIVGGKNRYTGISIVEKVTKEVVKITNGFTSVTYGIGD